MIKQDRDLSWPLKPHVAMSRICIISAQHDYRSLRRVNLHFIAQELVRHGPVRFFSCRFSNLSWFKSSDPRLNLFGHANRLEVNGFEQTNELSGDHLAPDKSAISLCAAALAAARCANAKDNHDKEWLSGFNE